MSELVVCASKNPDAIDSQNERQQVVVNYPGDRENNGHYYREEWERTKRFCCKCGKREVWASTQDSCYECSGRSHVCIACSSLWTQADNDGLDSLDRQRISQLQSGKSQEPKGRPGG